MHRFVEHVGEVEVELEAPTREGVFEAALEAFGELVGDGEEDGGAGGDREPARHEIDLEAGEPALLLVDWLGELVFLADVRRFVPERVVELELAGPRLRATVEGRLGEPRSLVKAVTLSRLRFERKGDAWRARVVLDV